MNFSEKSGRGEMLANAPVPPVKIARQLMVNEIDEWFDLVVEPENGEPAGLARYRRAALENIGARLWAKKVAIEKVLRDGSEHE